MLLLNGKSQPQISKRCFSPITLPVTYEVPPAQTTLCDLTFSPGFPVDEKGKNLFNVVIFA